MMNLDYIAGFFDGEGSFCISLTKTQETKYGYSFKPVIAISQRTSSILITIQKFLGFGTVRPDTYVIANKKDCRQFLSLIENKLQVKKEQAEVFREILALLEESKPKPQGYTTPRNKYDMLKLLDLIEKQRKMCKKGMKSHSIADIRREILNFDEEKYQNKIATYKQKRIDHLHEVQQSNKLKIDKETLLRLYVKEKVSGLEIAKILKCEKSAVYHRLHEYQIPLRPYSEAVKLSLARRR